MKSEKDKILKIMNELVCFFFKLKIMSPHIDICREDSKTRIVVEGEYKEPDYKEIRRFEEIMNQFREETVEEYYWNLAGHSEYPEITVIATLVESFKVKYENERLRIETIVCF